LIDTSISFSAESNVGMIFSEKECWKVVKPLAHQTRARNNPTLTYDVPERRQPDDVWNVNVCLF
jgi:hypothetical protein